MRRVHIKIYGKVQGVFFRAAAKEKAFEHCVFGWAKNLSDGSLHIMAEGDFSDVKKFINWCRRGPLPAKVDKIEFKFCPDLENFEDFEILYEV